MTIQKSIKNFFLKHWWGSAVIALSISGFNSSTFEEKCIAKMLHND